MSVWKEKGWEDVFRGSFYILALGKDAPCPFLRVHLDGLSRTKRNSDGFIMMIIFTIVDIIVTTNV